MTKTKQPNYKVKGVANQNETKFDIQDQKVKYHPNLEENTNCLSRLTFFYSRKIMQKGAKLVAEGKYLTNSDLFECKKPLHPTVQQQQVLDTVYNKAYKEKVPVKKNGSKLLMTDFLKIVLHGQHWKSAFIGLFGNLLQFAGPLFLKQILIFLEDSDKPTYQGYIWASCIFLCFFTKIFLTQNALDIINDFTIQLQNGVNSALLEKIFRLSSSSKKYFESGKIMNFLTVDRQQLVQLAQMSTIMFSSPFMIVISLVLICVELGWWGLMTPVFYVGSVIFQGKIQRYIFVVRKNILYWKDKRSKTVNEFFSGIRIVKYYAWEEVVRKRIEHQREQESKFLIKGNRIRAYIEEISNFTPVLISIIVFAIYVLAGNDLKPSKAYTVISYFNLLMLPFRMLIYSMMIFVGTKASLQRLNHFMDAIEMDEETMIENKDLEQGQIKIQNGVFGWETVEALEHLQKGQESQFNPKKQADKHQQWLDKRQKQVDELKKKDLSILKNINFEACKGQVIGVVGRVASGKSSFLHALLGEMNKMEGKVEKNGTIAYVSQTAWLQNASLQQNILFGNDFDSEWYQEVIEKCELQSDIEILPGGDQTEIGERGVNLSGGQKQRVAIARAVYAKADIYLIDDCLSALDGHVGKNIFNNVIMGILREKTVIFITHALQYMPQVDKVVVFDQGEIVEQGDFTSISSQPNSKFSELSVQIKKEQQEKEEQEEEGDSKETTQNSENQKKSEKQSTTLKDGSVPVKKAKETPEEIERKMKEQMEQGGLVMKEERAVGSVPWNVYFDYFGAAGKSLAITVLMALIIAQCCKIATDWWIGQWSSDNFDLSTGQYVGIYAIFGVLVSFFYFLRGYIFSYFTIKSADTYQIKLVSKLLKTPMYWFDVTPTGRIISRCTKDQDDIDQSLPFSLSVATQYTLLLFSTIILIGVILPLFFIVSITGLIIFYYVIKYYLCSARELKRVEAVATAPIISHFQESVNGTYIIRAFGKQQYYINNYLEKQHRYVVAFANFNYSQRWISMVTDLFSLIILSSACYFAVLSRQYNYVDDPSLMGLAISQAFQIITILSFTMKMIADTEAQMNALVRMLQYINENPEEMPWKTEEMKALQNNSKLQNNSSAKYIKAQKVDIKKMHVEMQVGTQNKSQVAQNGQEQWPLKGDFHLQNVSYKYRENLPEVIHGISFDIKENEKIAIVGRTGSGKSTMTLGLLRILEMSKNQKNNELGQIVLDSTNIADVGLHNLREKVTIIPQDPILFSGSLRFNVDPFEKYSREKLIEVLKKVQIWEQMQQFISAKKNDPKFNNNSSIMKKNKSQMPQHSPQFLEEEEILNFQIDDGGDNFSLGQRQLLCMARALIREPKVLLMDEATASIDEKTDHFIQKMIKQAFKNTTVITIAHRINTIMQYDRIVVLEQGNIVQIDTPYNLIVNFPEGIFAKLVDEGGPEFRQKMLYLAQNKDVIDTEAQ
ncbi:P-loop containing nucleoside triphosphate hydrolase [Pseudocohnilembus persalinus]|uniref:p-loop containing nucleoside triphosphate hydrolase n=1 Tax=Pseudocohnilembus persalinus TaxID=266149 RepID=A0A0V0QF44_PSEPJ|nr:P-loop containing nucleoside triphosphate hydrolase [Pseudocohnilembus persalinus]|eukprot:KRX00810.1 P-loop containing nucleoside triphosphate hydrolase [Pseudocohnilembus persalinus]